MKQWFVIGMIALGLGCAHTHKDKEDEGEEGNEVKMSISDVPAPVRATLMKEAGGATMGTVDKEEKDGQTLYETDVMSGGKNWEIRVDSSGTLISKKIDDESKEKKKGEKDEDEEKEEHGEHH